MAREIRFKKQSGWGIVVLASIDAGISLKKLTQKRRKRTMRPFVTIQVTLLGVCFFAAAGQSLPKTPSDDITVIQAYEGTWKIQIDTVDTEHSKAGHEETVLRNDCWRSGGYYACNQYVNGDSKVLIVFTYDPTKKTYTSYQVPPNGDAASSGVLEIKEKVWTFPWEQTVDGKTTHYRVVNVFDSPRRIKYRREFSADQTNWTVMATGNELRIS
jgi:hypothetical protein